MATVEAPGEPARERHWQRATTAALFALGLFVPWSTAGTSIALGVLLLLYLATPKRAFAATPWREPVVVAGLLLLAWILLRNLAALGWNPEVGRIANHYHELLMIPLLWAVMRLARRRDAFIAGLLLGAVGLAIAHWLPLPEAAQVKVDIRRISSGFGLALCAFVAFDEARRGRLPRAAGYGAAAFLALTVLFAVGARTGHLVLLLLAGCAAWRALPRRRRWAGVAGLGLLVLGAVALQSTLLERRGDIALSNQVRSELLGTTLDVVQAHWGIGAGWDGYRAEYAARAAAKGTPPTVFWARSDNPHNEYLMQAAGGGLPAVMLFVAWLALPVLAALRRRGRGGQPAATDAEAGVLACLALAFAVGCAFNSMLLDFSEGHLYGALFAWLMAQREPA